MGLSIQKNTIFSGQYPNVYPKLMETYVHKKLSGGAIHEFLCNIQEGGATNLQWKKGPYMNNTTLNMVRISHWPNRETLMLQGPTAATRELNERFIETQEKCKEIDTSTTMIRPEREKPPNVTERMIEDLQHYIRTWEYEQKPDINVYTPISAQSIHADTNKTPWDRECANAQSAQTKNAVHIATMDLKRDIFKYLNLHGFTKRSQLRQGMCKGGSVYR